MVKMIYSLLFCLLLGTSFALKDHCYAAILEGGGDKGAFQAGAMHEIAHSVSDVAYDVVTGISVGAINGGGLANFAPGDEEAATEWIVGLWRDLARDEVIEPWSFGGILRGILFQTGIYNDKPLETLLKARVEEAKRHFVYGYVD